MKMKKPRMIAQGRMLEIISTPKFVVKRSLWGWQVLFLMNQPCDISSTSVMQDGWGRVTALLWCLSQLVREAWAIGPPAVVVQHLQPFGSPRRQNTRLAALAWRVSSAPAFPSQIWHLRSFFSSHWGQWKMGAGKWGLMLQLCFGKAWL